ncbi:hypothetical protein Pla144_26740 [Bythopirellula polymerisocia]|uniref:Addiction module component n=2 Tax=Bythopirellula polymerisocia TaxID=2528003 RepID=A0A5C6CWI5_9BACT|nr:hypothetical protein Pla144_26740 [Bythopirellula polymerisocia]
MSQGMQFGEVLEAADHLSPDEQQQLIVILNNRLTQAARQNIVNDVKEADAEFTAGECRVVTPAELMREIQK